MSLLFLSIFPPPPPRKSPGHFHKTMENLRCGSGEVGDCRRVAVRTNRTETDNARRTDKQIFSWTLARLCICESKMAKDLTRMPSLSEVDLSGSVSGKNRA